MWFLLIVGQNDRQVVPMKVRVSRDYEQHAWWSVAKPLVPNLLETPACKVAERASLSVVYAWPAADSRIHHR